MKKLTYTLLILLSLHCTFNSASAGWDSLDSTSHALISRGLHQINTNDYQNALCSFRELVNIHPERPVGYLGLATVYQTIMRNYRVKTVESTYDSLLTVAIKIGEQAIRANDRDVLAYLYVGGAYGYRGLFKIRKRMWFGALKDGWRGLARLKKCIELDATLYDAYLGLGIFNYWRSAKNKLFNFLPFFNKKQKGIEQIRLAIDHGKYTEVKGKFALIYIYYDYGKFQEALTINDELYRYFPQNAACLYMRSRLLEKLKYWQESKNYYEILLTHLEKTEYKSIGYLIECHYGLAKCHFHTDNYETALLHMKKAQYLQIFRDSTLEIEGPLEDSKDIIIQVENLQKKINLTHNRSENSISN